MKFEINFEMKYTSKSGDFHKYLALRAKWLKNGKFSKANLYFIMYFGWCRMGLWSRNLPKKLHFFRISISKFSMHPKRDHFHKYLALRAKFNSYRKLFISPNMPFYKLQYF